MIEKHALLFAAATAELSEIKWISSHTERGQKPNLLARQRICQAGKDAIGKTKHALIMSDMDSVIPEADRLSDALDVLVANPDFALETVAQSLKHLVSRITDELENEFYFHVDRQNVSLYGNKELFGPAVSKKFRRSISDIEGAGSCLALHLPTACVFHLSRVMETGVQRLGKKLKVSINPKTESWNKIIDHINVEITKLPGKTEKDKHKRAQCATASSYLRQAALAWRNEVMHPKESYTLDEAHDIFNASKAFMNHLAGLI